ncbi:MAG: MaoC family dehydratase [SAR202 cluster bacterium]|nr:MaoC family dehydratase [SAR202 cluster bacterium]
MPVDYGALSPGQTISRHTYVVDDAMVDRYVDAVQDESHMATERELAPPMSIAALSLTGVVQDLQIPGGTLHVGQEFQFSAAVSVGATLECVATLKTNSIRGGWRFMVVDSVVTEGGNRLVMTGKSTITLPEDLAGGGAGK